MENIKLILEPNFSEIRNAREIFREVAHRNNVSDSDECDIEIVIGELLTNVIEHGMENGKYSTIFFEMYVSEEFIDFFVKYKGIEITNETLEKYKTLDEVSDAEELLDHGRGLFIMYNIMDSVNYKYENNIVTIELKKRLKKS